MNEKLNFKNQYCLATYENIVNYQHYQNWFLNQIKKKYKKELKETLKKQNKLELLTDETLLLFASKKVSLVCFLDVEQKIWFVFINFGKGIHLYYNSDLKYENSIPTIEKLISQKSMREKILEFENKFQKIEFTDDLSIPVKSINNIIFSTSNNENTINLYKNNTVMEIDSHINPKPENTNFGLLNFCAYITNKCYERNNYKDFIHHIKKNAKKYNAARSNVDPLICYPKYDEKRENDNSILPKKQILFESNAHFVNDFGKIGITKQDNSCIIQEENNVENVKQLLLHHLMESPKIDITKQNIPLNYETKTQTHFHKNTSDNFFLFGRELSLNQKEYYKYIIKSRKVYSLKDKVFLLNQYSVPFIIYERLLIKNTIFFEPRGIVFDITLIDSQLIHLKISSISSSEFKQLCIYNNLSSFIKSNFKNIDENLEQNNFKLIYCKMNSSKTLQDEFVSLHDILFSNNKLNLSTIIFPEFSLNENYVKQLTDHEDFLILFENPYSLKSIQYSNFSSYNFKWSPDLKDLSFSNTKNHDSFINSFAMISYSKDAHDRLCCYVNPKILSHLESKIISHIENILNIKSNVPQISLNEFLFSQLIQTFNRISFIYTMNSTHFWIDLDEIISVMLNSPLFWYVVYKYYYQELIIRTASTFIKFPENQNIDLSFWTPDVLFKCVRIYLIQSCILSNQDPWSKIIKCKNKNETLPLFTLIQPFMFYSYSHFFILQVIYDENNIGPFSTMLLRKITYDNDEIICPFPKNCFSYFPSIMPSPLFANFIDFSQFNRIIHYSECNFRSSAYYDQKTGQVIIRKNSYFVPYIFNNELTENTKWLLNYQVLNVNTNEPKNTELILHNSLFNSQNIQKINNIRFKKIFYFQIDFWCPSVDVMMHLTSNSNFKQNTFPFDSETLQCVNLD